MGQDKKQKLWLIRGKNGCERLVGMFGGIEPHLNFDGTFSSRESGYMAHFYAEDLESLCGLQLEPGESVEVADIRFVLVSLEPANAPA